MVKHPIEPPITAVALRFHPTAWSGDMCMRVEAFGCDGRFRLALFDVLHMCIVVITGRWDHAQNLNVCMDPKNKYKTS